MVNILSRSDHITPKRLQKEFYSDFPRTFDMNPQKGDLVKLTNADSVKHALENLVLTNFGERFYHPDIGGNLMASLFEPADEITLTRLQSGIAQTIREHEPRIDKVKVTIENHSDQNYLAVRLEFSIINIPDQTFLQVLTKRIR